ncbi:lysylphosphatidylglycerol synthase transmembrane domain-containing protein [Daejeonella sp. H1SJ63]|uniref:lysylphosphatidylglycerol synthase transmembrane domain-containing protein n=1 Tax=Daejeonella sp. H1SJ63 TaxID=3034145 RepID=UPI0023EC7A2F|nr:lysylphosphatidylglycerol synthase transmembrane domain-containing protein [Daejeonella sp. H1SJ63]
MKKLFSSGLKYIILLILGIGLLILAFRGQDFNKLVLDLQKANYKWVLASIFFAALAHVLRAYRWRMMIAALGYGKPAMMNTLFAVFTGYLANLAFPRMGEVSRCGVLHKTDGIPVVKLIGTVVAERIIDFLMLLLITAAGILIQFELLSDFIYKHILIKFSERSSGSGILIFVICLILFVVIGVIMIIKKKKPGIFLRVSNLISDIQTGILSVRAMDHKLLFALYSAMIWGLYGISAYLCFPALTATANLGFAGAISTLIFSSFAMIAPVQGGIGAYHWMVSEGLTIYGISKSDGLAYALLTHSAQTLIILIAGSISLILLFIRSSKTKENG